VSDASTAEAFELSTSMGSRAVVVAASGEVDVLTAPLLGGVLGALIDQGRTHVVVDLADVTLLDASGLRAIVEVVGRLGLVGGHLRLRSPVTTVRRVLELSSLGSLIDPDGSPVVDGVPTLVIRPAPDTAVVDAALRLVTSLTQAAVRGADGASVSLTRGGRLTSVAATDATVAPSRGMGPCLAAAAGGHGILVHSLDEEDRWPTFIARARQEGIGSILSTPLVVASRSVGALNIYANAARAFAPEDQELAAVFASAASGILGDSSSDPASVPTAARLRAALEGRAVIAQAQGVVMVRQGLSSDGAFAALLRSARENGEPVRQLADAIVAGTLLGGPPGEAPA
jgi:anti-anti-sigma factor